MLHRLAFTAVVACAAQTAHAGPNIEVNFETDSGSSQKLIHAEALFPARRAVIHDIFTAITEYPALHEWIVATQLVQDNAESQEVLVEFRFPWPVGREWSRVEVRHLGQHAIHWHQIEGSLKANRGEIRFTTLDGRAHIVYRAVIDVGLPDAWTRHYKQKFVAEFLGAVADRATASSTTRALTLATSGRR